MEVAYGSDCNVLVVISEPSGPHNVLMYVFRRKGMFSSKACLVIKFSSFGRGDI